MSEAHLAHYISLIKKWLEYIPETTDMTYSHADENVDSISNSRIS